MSVFRNIQHQKKFDEDGYVILSLITPDVLDSLRQIHHEEFVPNKNPTWALNAGSGADKNNYLASEQHRLLTPLFDQVMVNSTNYGGTFFTKPKGYPELRLHQDTTMVDSDRGFGCYTWIPLDNVDENNGCLFVIRGSHLFFNNLISFTYKNDGIDRLSIPTRFVQSLPMKAGEVLFFNVRIFHGSHENNSDKVRVAVNVPIMGEGVPFVYYNKKDENTAQEFIVSPESYRNSYKAYSSGLPPEGSIFVRDFAYRHIAIDEQALIKSCQDHIKEPRSVLRRLKERFIGI